MTRRVFLVEIEHTGLTDAAFDELFAQYLTLPEHPFLSDYGPRSDLSGWTGPFVTGVAVVGPAGRLAEWSKP